MKKIVSIFAATALVATMMTTSSCSKTCDAGYEGSDCKTQVRTKFIGSYTASDSKNGGSSQNYPTTITAGTGTDVTEVLITRVTPSQGGFFTNYVKGKVSGTTLTIANQNPDADAYTIDGSATISGSTLNITYKISGPDSSGTTVTDNYAGTWTR